MVPVVLNAARKLAVHMSHSGLEHWKEVGHFIDLKGKNTKVIIVRNHKVLKAVMFCDYIYNTNKGKKECQSSSWYTSSNTINVSVEDSDCYHIEQYKGQLCRNICMLAKSGVCAYVTGRSFWSPETSNFFTKIIKEPFLKQIIGKLVCVPNVSIYAIILWETW